MPTLPLGQCSMIACLRTLILAGVLSSAAVLPTFAAEADLALAVTADPASVVVDQDLRFFVDLVNHGPDSAEDVTIEIDLPAEVRFVAASPTQGICQSGPPVTCQLGQVSADASLNKVGVTVDTIPTAVADLSLAATVASSTADLFLGNNAATALSSIVSLLDSADLIVEPQIRPSLAFPGATMEYLIELANTGPALAEGVDLRVGIQELRMASYVSVSSSRGSCSAALDTCAGLQCQEVLEQLLEVSCDLGNMPADNTGWVRVTANIDLPVQTHLTVSIDLEARETADSDTSNNVVEVDVPVVERPEDGGPVPVEPPLDAGGIGGCFFQTVLW